MTNTNDDAVEDQIDAYVSKADRMWVSPHRITSSSADDPKDEHFKGSLIMQHNIWECPSQPEAVLAIDEGIRKYWKDHGDIATKIWNEIAADSRRNLILAILPDAGNIQQSSMKKTLLPEFADIKAMTEHSNTFIELIQETVLSRPLHLHYRLDAQMIQRYVDDGKLEADTSKDDLIALFEGGSYPGELMQFDRERLQTVNPTLAGKFAELISDGIALEGPIFAHVVERRHMLLQLIAMVLDEIRGVVVMPAMCCNHGCSQTYFRGGSNGPSKKATQALQRCQRCGQVAYCSRECQIKDWKQGHKQECAKWAATK